MRLLEQAKINFCFIILIVKYQKGLVHIVKFNSF